jgi:hypothetical protein
MGADHHRQSTERRERANKTLPAQPKEFAVTLFDMPLISERVQGGHEFARRARVK